MSGATMKYMTSLILLALTGCAGINNGTYMSGGRHLLPSAVSLRTQRATFTALGSSLH
jgi:hypothetical protein